MRQSLYKSRCSKLCRQADLDVILQISRHNCAIDGVLGLLWTNGSLFLQVVEGASDAVAALVRRLKHDPRHYDMVVLIDRGIAAKEFGLWSIVMRSLGARR